jgi:hypothetical protein
VGGGFGGGGGLGDELWDEFGEGGGGGGADLAAQVFLETRGVYLGAVFHDDGLDENDEFLAGFDSFG